MNSKTMKAIMAGMLPAAAFAQEQPNIIMFLVDDMGWQETSVPFYKERTLLNDRYRTPNMERLAQMGVKFTNAYSCPVSSPSRCSLMSGMNAARHRVTNWISEYNTNTNASGSSLDLPDWNYNGIQPENTTKSADKVNSTLVTPLAQLLRNAGYYTIHCGKGNYGASTTSASDPTKMGFVVNIGGSAAGSPGSYLAADNYGTGFHHVPGLDSYYEKGTFLTEALTLEALKKIKQSVRINRPFFLYFAHYAIHTPYNADPRFTGNYMDDTQGVYDPMLNARLNTSEINHAALIEGMDKSLGDLLDYLSENDSVAKNTIILFMSDNGGQALSPRQGQYNRVQNYPARGGKGSSYDGGVHEPMIVYWPGVTEGGTENKNRVMIEDFYPTILSMANIHDYQTVQTVDGKDFTDLLKDPSLQRDRVTIWHYPNRWGESADRAEGYGSYSAIMKGTYHMIYFWESGERRLYDLSNDPGEENNLADAKPELLQQMAQELTDSLKSMDAQRPKVKATGEFVVWPSEVTGQEETYSAGDVLPAKNVVKLSTADKKIVYTISDNRPSSTDGPYYWTQGEQCGYKALQCTNENYAETENAAKQQFYFMAGATDKSFKLYTADGKAVGYLEGTAKTKWNATTTQTIKYMQYDVEASDFQFVMTEKEGYFAIKTPDGELLNDRSTSNGAQVNMQWVIMPYSGNHIGDAGSRYRFNEVGVQQEPTYETGDVVPPSENIFKMSNNDEHYLYTVKDNRPTPFYWTRGTYLEQKALQCTTESLLETNNFKDQLFYFLPGESEDAFKMYTAVGEPVDYVSGTARIGWSDYNTGTFLFMQYGTEQAGDLRLIKSDYDNYYGIRAKDELISDRGTSHGDEANMSWVIMTYSGNHLGDKGSRYIFDMYGKVTTGLNNLNLRDGKVEIYDMEGHRVNKPQQKGVYIIRQNGKTVKMVK